MVILPRSPWLQSDADNAKLGAPTEDNVADIFEAISPLLPTPHKIIFPLQFTIASTEGTVAAGPLDVQGTVDVQGTLVVVW